VGSADPDRTVAGGSGEDGPVTDRLLQDLALARGPLRVDVTLRDNPGWWDVAVSQGAEAVAVTGATLDARDDKLVWRTPRPEDRDRSVLLGVHGRPRIAVLDEPENAINLREVGANLSDEDAAWATTAVALAQWHSRNQHCPDCGSATEVTSAGWSRACPVQQRQIFPRTDPAVIVLCRDHEDRALLGRRVEWPASWMSTLAGFVEAGESAEHAVLREVQEEVGVVLDPQRLHYRGSQPWPFPASLMLGYHAWSIEPAPQPVPDGTEIVQTRWVSREEIVDACESGSLRIPPEVSIARKLIEDWFGGPLPGPWSRPPSR
jgi:NAD+ diphosphatase